MCRSFSWKFQAIVGIASGSRGWLLGVLQAKYHEIFNSENKNGKSHSRKRPINWERLQGDKHQKWNTVIH